MGSGRTVAILDRLSQFVDARSRQRGETYFEADNVGQVTIDSVGTIVAEVYGRDMYDVWLAFDAGSRSLRVGCTCPHFDNGNVCKHVWAVLLSAADRDLLPDVAVNCVMLDHGDDENSLESHDADGDDDDEDWSDTPVYGPLTEHDRQFNNLVQGVGKPRGTRGWEQQLDVVSHTMTRGDGVSDAVWPADRQIVYVIDKDRSITGVGLAVDILMREPKRDGEWSKPRAVRLGMQQAATLPDPSDRRIVSLLAGGDESRNSWYSVPSRVTLPPAGQETMVRWMCSTGRCFIYQQNDDRGSLKALKWDDGGAWSLCLKVKHDATAKRIEVTGELHRDGQMMAMGEPRLLTTGGLVFMSDHVAAFEHHDAFAWVPLLRDHGSVSAPVDQAEALVAKLMSMPRLPVLDLPQALRMERVSVRPGPRIRVRKSQRQAGYWGGGPDMLGAELTFDYDGQVVQFSDPRAGLYDADRRCLMARDMDEEMRAWARLRRLGFKAPTYSYRNGGADLELAARHLSATVATLLAEGWRVEADGKVYRTAAGQLNLHVRSGIDWFEVHGRATFDD